MPCLIEAVKHRGSVVYVEDGDYDLVKEFEDYYGKDFFLSYSADSPKGIMLYNDVHVIFSSKANVTFFYTGDNSVVKSTFSPFNSSLNGGFILENLHIKAKNCRYVVHDEMSGTTTSYTNKYLNCNMYIDNSENTAWESKQCIGGGLGYAGYILVDGCLLDSETEQEVAFVSYHTDSSSPVSKSAVNIRNNCIKRKGTVGCLWTGTTTNVTSFVITNNSLGSSIIHRSSGSDNDNTELIEWNNNIRYLR